jgi:hypothetical protein
MLKKYKLLTLGGGQAYDRSIYRVIDCLDSGNAVRIWAADLSIQKTSADRYTTK